MKKRKKKQDPLWLARLREKKRTEQLARALKENQADLKSAGQAVLDLLRPKTERQ